MRWAVTIAVRVSGLLRAAVVLVPIVSMTIGPASAQSTRDTAADQPVLSDDLLSFDGVGPEQPFSGGSDRFSSEEPRPLASPVAPVDSDGVVRTATFDTGGPMAMAVFVRDTALWMVFAADHPLDAATLARQGELGLGTPLVADARGGIALRFDNEAERRPTISQNGTAWTVTLPAGAPDAPPSLASVSEPGHPDGARLFLAAAGAIRPVAFVDPVIGDILVAMPLTQVDQGVDGARRFVEFHLVPSTLGIVIRPMVDDIRVRPVDGGVAITSESGLQLS